MTGIIAGHLLHVGLIVLHITIVQSYIRRSGREPVCPGIDCYNDGTVDTNTCTCVCTDGYTGVFCKTELKSSKWPRGHYSLLSTVFGCPESDNYGWHRGFINMTLHQSRPEQRWKVPIEDETIQMTADPHILGPYHYHSLQLNFCTRLDNVTVNQDDNETFTWPEGDYCIFQAGDECPIGFNESSVTLGGYTVTWDDTDGTLPKVSINNTASVVTLVYCCREDSREKQELNLPYDFPFILLKINTSSCNGVKDMEVSEERFDLVDDLGLFTFEGHLSIFKQNDSYQRLGLCYYADTGVRDCFDEYDDGFSYRGTINTTYLGEPCLNWIETLPNKFSPSKEYVGDFPDNHCRKQNPWSSLEVLCLVYRDSVIYYVNCEIPKCESDQTVEKIGTFKPVYAVPHFNDKIAENAVDGSTSGNPFESDRPRQKSWFQVDLEEMLEVHSVLVHRKYVWFPINFRFVSVHISNYQWDFFNYGSLQCEKRKYPRQAYAFHFVCSRPIVGQYVTIRNFDDPNPDNTWGTYYFLEISEIQIFVKRNICGRRLGLLSGDVRDFQLSGSDDLATNMFLQGRLLLPGIGWCSEIVTGAYFMIDLIVPMVVRGLEIQGWLAGLKPMIVTKYTLDYGVHENVFTPYVDYRGEVKVFKLDTSLPTDMIQRFILSEEIIARSLRINIKEYIGRPCMKMEVLGCPKTISRDLMCSNTSMDFGYEVNIRAGFWMEDSPLLYGSENETVDYCDSSDECVGFYHTVDEADIFTSTRYNPHYQHKWVSELGPEARTYMKLCLKDIKSHTECSSTLTEPTILESPSYPFYYGQLLGCTWSVRFPSDKYIRIEVVDIKMAAPDTDLKLRETGVLYIHPGTCTDTLHLGDITITSENEATYRRAVILSESSSMSISLQSCARYSMTDAIGFMFNLTYSDIPGCYAKSTECFATCTKRQAGIMSPGFPSDSLPPSSCRWRIEGEVGTYVHFKFMLIDIPSDSDVCSVAYVAVNDVSLFNIKTEIGRYCSSNIPVTPINSSWQFMEIEFVSGDEVTNYGFVAQYVLIDYVQDVIENSTEDCDTWQRYGNHCYEIFRVDAGLTWLAADSKCHNYGGHLISLTSQQEVTFLHYMLTERWMLVANGESDFYIGLQKIGDSGRFGDLRWSDGSPVTFTSWYSDPTNVRDSQPNGLDNEKCSLLRLYSIQSTHNWHDVACAYDKIKLFICERKTHGFKNDTNMAISSIIVPPSEGNLIDMFECASGGFIQSVYQCDRHADCFDRSDERDCDPVCTDEMFHCDDGDCINAGLHCDFRPDCNDTSDEKYCVYADCQAREWRCLSGQCIPDIYRCDVKHDCLDGSDELDCRSCHNSTFQCYDQRCVAQSRVCDGYNDCSGVFYEDEDNTCIRNTRASCADWYSIGKRENGSYFINLDYYAGFEAECRFFKNDAGKQIVETIVHHQFEAPVTWSSGDVEVVPKYAARSKQIDLLKQRSVCKQYFANECSYSLAIIWWVGHNKEKYYSNANTDDCTCPYIEICDSPRGRCNCDNIEHKMWYGVSHHEFRKDEGFVTNQEALPIKSINTLDVLETNFVTITRTTLGPLVCQEELSDIGISDQMVCANDDLAHVSARCVLDFDDYGEVIGCRDLSHLQMDCENHECQSGQTRCISEHYCIPRWLICDGVQHCPDGEDEEGCENGGGNYSCQGSYHCRRSYSCIEHNQLCDGHANCPLADDEMFCDRDCPSGCSCYQSSMTCNSTDILGDTLTAAWTFSRFRILKISHSLFELSAASLKRFPFLNHLNVSVCDLEYLAPFQFRYTVNLMVLDLSFNKLKVLVANTFYGLHMLRLLLVKGNPLKSVEVKAFVNLDSLPELDLSQLQLTSIDEKIFIGLDKLSKLNISNNRIGRIQAKVFDTLQNVEVLDIESNDITDFNEEIFAGLSSLKVLYTTSFIFCCVRPDSVTNENCFSPKDEFSSCADLMKNETLRAFLWIIGLSALLGNIFVIVFRFSVDREGLGRTYGIFVSNLSIADFFMGMYLIIIAVADTVFRGSYVWNDYQWRNGIACQIAGVLSTVGSEGSVIFLCFITIDRLLVVKFPFGHVRISKRTSLIMCVLAWIVIFSISLIPLQLDSYFNGSFYSRSAVCLALPLTRDRPPGWQYSIAIFIVFNFLAFVLIASAQIVIYREVKLSSGKMASKGRRQDIVIARKLFFVAITDFMCWFPVGLMGMLALNEHVISGDVYAWIAVFVLPINSALNPFLYTLGSSSRSKLSSTKKGRNSSRRKNDTTGSSMSIKEVFESDLFEFGKSTKRRNMNLTDLMLKRNLSVKEALAVMLRLAKGMFILHSKDMTHGGFTPSNIIVREVKGIIRSVVLKSTPEYTYEEPEFKNDILNFGTTLKTILKSTDIPKNHGK